MNLFKEYTTKQKFIFSVIMLIGIILMVCILLITQTDAVMTFHVTSDNNTLEIFKTINYTAIGGY